MPSTAPEIQKQFNPDGGWDGPPEPKNRFLSVTAGDTGQLQAIRVTWDAMPNWPGGHTALIGQQKWLLEPFRVCEGSGQGIGVFPNCGPSPGQPQKTFWAALLTCDPSQAWFGDLAGLANYCTGSGEACDPNAPVCSSGTCRYDGVIHIIDAGIVPSKNNPAQPAAYSVQVIDETCGLLDEGYSDPLVVINPIWGDVLRNSGTCPTLPGNGIVDLLGDVVGVINKFGNLSCAAKKTRVDVEPGTPDFKINFTDVVQILTGFTGGPYPFAAPDPCAAAQD